MTRPLSRSSLDLCTPISILTWGNIAEERVTSWHMDFLAKK